MGEFDRTRGFGGGGEIRLYGDPSDEGIVGHEINHAIWDRTGETGEYSKERMAFQTAVKQEGSVTGYAAAYAGKGIIYYNENFAEIAYLENTDPSTLASHPNTMKSYKALIAAFEQKEGPRP
jgi:hypothetical protein